MRVHVEKDIFISSSAGGLGFRVDRLIMVNVIDKDSKEVVGQREDYKTVAGGNFTSLSGAINGVLKFKVTESKAVTLTQLAVEIKQ